MKKFILILSGVAVLAAGAYFGNRSTAQQPAGGAGAQAANGTKVAVVNVGYVFSNYKRAQAFKEQIEGILKQPKADAMKLIEEMKGWEAAMNAEKDVGKKEQYAVAIRNAKRKLEDLNLDIQKLIGKKQEDNLMTLWKEVNTGVERVAQAYGFQVVLGYGDPMEKQMLDLFPNINRKMGAMDAGGMVPLYVHGSVDLSEVITRTLNQWAGGAAVPAQPASNTK